MIRACSRAAWREEDAPDQARVAPQQLTSFAPVAACCVHARLACRPSLCRCRFYCSLLVLCIFLCLGGGQQPALAAAGRQALRVRAPLVQGAARLQAVPEHSARDCVSRRRWLSTPQMHHVSTFRARHAWRHEEAAAVVANREKLACSRQHRLIFVFFSVCSSCSSRCAALFAAAAAAPAGAAAESEPRRLVQRRRGEAQRRH